MTDDCETSLRGRFHSRRSNSFCRSNSFLPEISSNCETCFRVGHFLGQIHFSRKKCDVILELKCIFTPLFLGRPIRIVRFQKRFLEGCHLRHCRGVNLNFCLFLKTRAIALVLKKREVLLYTGAFKPRKSVSDSTSECQKYTPKFT